MEKQFSSKLFGAEARDMLEAFQGKSVRLVNQIMDPSSERFREQIANVIRTFGVDVRFANEVLDHGWHLVIVSKKSPAVSAASDSNFARFYLEEFEDPYEETIAIASTAVKEALYKLLIREELQRGILTHLSGKLNRLVRGWSFAVFSPEGNRIDILRIHEEGIIECLGSNEEDGISPLYEPHEKEKVLCLVQDAEGHSAAILESGEVIPPKAVKTGKKNSIPECSAEKLAAVKSLRTIEKDRRFLYYAEPGKDEYLGMAETCVHEVRTDADHGFDLESLLSMIQTAEVRGGRLCALPFPVRILREYQRFEGERL